MKAKEFYEILIGIIGMSSLIALGVVILLIIGLFF